LLIFLLPELEKLQGQACRSPKAKAELLVAVHKLIVGELPHLVFGGISWKLNIRNTLQMGFLAFHLCV
jgi:hypothetical protein